MIRQDQAVVLVHEHADAIDGFVIVFLHDAPPVYELGGPICTIDDFTVAAPDLWLDVGRALLDVAVAVLFERGAVQAAVVCGRHDAPKRAMLDAAGFPIVSEWRVKAVERGFASSFI